MAVIPPPPLVAAVRSGVSVGEGVIRARSFGGVCGRVQDPAFASGWGAGGGHGCHGWFGAVVRREWMRLQLMCCSWGLVRPRWPPLEVGSSGRGSHTMTVTTRVPTPPQATRLWPGAGVAARRGRRQLRRRLPPVVAHVAHRLLLLFVPGRGI